MYKYDILYANYFFQQKEFKSVFLFCLKVLSDIQKLEGFGDGSRNNSNQEITIVLKRFLSITEHILTWEFLPLHGRKGSVGSNSSPTFKPPVSWRDTVLDKGLLTLLFSVSFHP